MDNLNYLENVLGETFNTYRDELAVSVVEAVKQQKNVQLHDLELGNWVHSTVNVDGDDDMDSTIKVTSTIVGDSTITLNLESANNELFDGTVSIELSTEQAAAYSNMMLVGQTYDVYEGLKLMPTPELNEEYNPYILPEGLLGKL